jgi:hypothetical protein
MAVPLSGQVLELQAPRWRYRWPAAQSLLSRAFASLTVLTMFTSYLPLLQSIRLALGFATRDPTLLGTPRVLLLKAALWLAAALVFFLAAGVSALRSRPPYLRANPFGVLLAVIAYSCWYLGGFSLVVWRELPPINGSFLFFAAAWLIADKLVAKGAQVFALARRTMARASEEVLEADPRAPILYLRSFAADEAPAPEELSLDEREGRLLTWRVMNPDFWKERREWTFEEVVCGSLSEIGPVVALGRPGERLPRIGAARKRVDEADWQAEVRALLERCRLVCLVVGHTQGLLWELREILSGHNAMKMLLVIPPGADASTLWDGLLRNLEPVLRSRLPAAVPPSAIAIHFDSNQEATVLAGRRNSTSYRQIALRLHMLTVARR